LKIIAIIIPLIPALLIKVSIWPKASHAFCTDLSMVLASAETSSSTATTARRVPYRLFIWWQREWRRSRWRAAAMILQPAFARSRQNSWPRPEEAPVTNTTLSSSLCHGSRCPESCAAIDLWIELELTV